jgi:beta-galactosidase
MKLLSFLILLLMSHAAIAQVMEVRDGQFLYGGESVRILSGEMHYARVPREYWQHRLKMIKAMGLNTVATYVFWNYHNTAPGVWDFKNGNRDLAAFIRMAQQEGLFVILRPGPYACAEWEFGGYPWWLQKNPSLEIRTMNQPFLDSCRVYLQHLADEVGSLQASKGGPIILVQVENEFGSYVAQRKDIPMENHHQYNRAIASILKEVGFQGPFFTSDGSWLFDGGALSGVLPTANGEHDINNLKKVVDAYHDNQGPYMVAEYYPGWLDHWAEPFVRVSTDQIVKQVELYLQNNVHFNFYMVHGGTNFGFTSGANYNNEFDLQPDITSYDYDAPISEAGWATEKYRAIRNVIQRYSKQTLPPIPDPIPVITPVFNITHGSDALAWAREQVPVMLDTPATFETLNQGHGYVLYSKQMERAMKGTLRVDGLRDYALVYVNGKRVGELNRIFKQYTLNVDMPAGALLEIWVENMGRINYGAQIVHNSKGIISPVYLNEQALTGKWMMRSLPMDDASTLGGKRKAIVGRPAFYRAEVTLDSTGDIFLDMRGWGKGIVFVNGHAIGRYWKVGPQQTLYVPGCWLKKGTNEVIIFEQQNDTLPRQLNTVPQPILDEVRK